MSKDKNMSQGSVLMQLYNNKLLRSKVDAQLDAPDGMTYTELVELCAEYDVEISTASLSRYKKRRQEAIETGKDLEELLDGRKKSGSVIDIKTEKEKRSEHQTLTGDTFEDTFGTVEKVYSDIQVLDEIIQKGYNALQYTDTVEIPHALRAIETRARLTDNSMQGLSLVGLRELRLRSEAKRNAMLESIMKYVPEEQHEELLDYIDEQEEEFYKNLDLTEEDQKITDALKSADIEF